MINESEQKAESLLRRMTVDFSIDLWQSSECSLVCVDEILSLLKRRLTPNEMEEEIKLYEKVREELEKYQK